MYFFKMITLFIPGLFEINGLVDFLWPSLAVHLEFKVSHGQRNVHLVDFERSHHHHHQGTLSHLSGILSHLFGVGSSNSNFPYDPTVNHNIWCTYNLSYISLFIPSLFSNCLPLLLVPSICNLLTVK